MKHIHFGKKLNDRGAGIVMVIVAMALVAILASVLMSISLLNFQMKSVEKNAKSNFYATEEALDAIHAGLELVVSEATDAAYLTSMQTYKLDAITEQYRIAKFNADYMGNIMNALKDPVKGSEFYYIGGKPEEFDAGSGLYTAGLASYLPSELAGYMNAGKLKITAKNPGTKNMRYTTQGLILEGIQVSYTDDNGYYSEIETDIRIGYPDIDLNESTVIPNVFESSLIANESIVIDSMEAYLSGNIFAGDDGLVFSDGNTTLESADYVVTSGEIVIESGAMADMTGDNLWTRGIALKGSGELETSGSVYVQDDLTITGSGGTVKLQGNYYGYGDGGDGEHPARGNSAIVLNCKEVELDMNGLDELMLCGNAYINGEIIEYETQWGTMTNPAVMLGSSVAMKTDQIAFLVPPECLGTLNGEPYLGRNPMTEEEYNLWKSTNIDGYKRFDTDVPTDVLKTPLKSYDFKVKLQTIFKNVGTENLCYFYLSFSDAELANNYYNDYMTIAEERMESYLERYGNTIKFDSVNTEQLTKGNILVYEEEKGYVPPISGTINSSMEEELQNELDAAKNDYANAYHALCSKLSTNYNGLSEEEKLQNVYSNIVLDSAIAGLSVAEVYEFAGNRAVVINGDIQVGAEAEKAEYRNLQLVIASGDVEVKGDFSGLIISGGTVNVLEYTGVDITPNKEAVTKLLQYKPETLGGYSIIETYFEDGDKYLLKGNTFDEAAYVNLEQVISYMNWTKK